MLLDSPQPENQIKKCSAGSIQREELETQREVIMAAANLQFTKMEHLELTQIVKCALVVISHGRKIPLCHKIFITFRTATSLEADADDEVWIVTITLVIGTGAWDVPRPRFGMLDLHLLTDEETINYACTNWTASVVTDKFIRLIGDVTGGDPPGSNRKLLTSMCMTFLKQVGPDPEVDYPEKLRNIATHVKKAYRGIAALANPRPCVAELSDVRYVMPPGTASPIVDDIPRFGRVIVSKLRKTEWWPKELQEFESCVGSEHLAGPIVNKVELDLLILKGRLEQASAEDNPEQELALLNELARSSTSLSERHGDWKQCFRKGGLNDMSKAFLTVMEYVVANGTTSVSSTSVRESSASLLPAFVKGMVAVSSLHSTDEPETINKMESLIVRLKTVHSESVGRATVSSLLVACNMVAGCESGGWAFPFQDMEVVTQAVVSMRTAARLDKDVGDSVKRAVQAVVTQLVDNAMVEVSPENELSLDELKVIAEFFDTSGPGSIATDVSSVVEHALIQVALASFAAVGNGISFAHEAFADGNAGERRSAVRLLGTKFQAAESELSKRHSAQSTALVAGVLGCLSKHTRPHMERSQGSMQHFASRLLEEDMAAITDAMAVLEPIAGGGSAGLWWWQDKKDFESVLDVYHRTLSKAPKSGIERASTVVAQAALYSSRSINLIVVSVFSVFLHESVI